MFDKKSILQKEPVSFQKIGKIFEKIEKSVKMFGIFFK